MKKFIYYLFKTINWIMFFVSMSVRDAHGFQFYVTLGYFIFAVLWYFWHNTRSRLTYQAFFFGGYIIGLYNTFTKGDTAFEQAIHTSSDSITTKLKIILIIICVIAFASKIVTMLFETENYNLGAEERHNNKLDEEVVSATYELERARTPEEKRKAEARLERAKLNKERNYIKDKD